MKGKLIDDITVQEMRQMREDGLSNREIADRLDVCYATVLRHLSKQKGRMCTPKNPHPCLPEPAGPRLKPVLEVVTGEIARFTLDRVGRTIKLELANGAESYRQYAGTTVTYDEAADLLQDMAALGQYIQG